MFKNMQLSVKLLIFFLLVGVIPFATIGVISLTKSKAALTKQAFNQLEAVREIKKAQIEQFFDDSKGDMKVLSQTVDTLRSESFKKLKAVREIKKASLENYFQLVEDQITSFSSDISVVGAMDWFREVIKDVRTEIGITPEEMESLKDSLLSYYTNEFIAEYNKRNKENPNIDGYFQKLDDQSIDDIAIALQYYYIKENENPLGSKHLLDKASDNSSYTEYHAQVHTTFKKYLEKFDYYDIFLVDSETGNIVYSVYKEIDFATSLINGPFAQTNLGEAFRKANTAVDKDAVVFVDYEEYFPSYDTPTSFIASPIFYDEKKIGVAIFQIPQEKITDIVSKRQGLGETGETYLVGPDHLMRSDSYRDPENHSVIASFRNPGVGKVETETVNMALSGNTAVKVTKNYNGNLVLSAYTNIKVGDKVWALLVELDVAEAFCPKDKNGEYFFAKYIKEYGYYDLFLLNPDGYCYYTVAQESDYQTNLVNGKYSGSNLGKLVQNVLKTKKYGVADFAPYEASNNEPASFIAQPIVHDGKTEVIVALQLPDSAINDIMLRREGMGSTGETYLVGSDKLMRSDAYLDQAGHSMKASFSNPEKGSVNTKAVDEAFSDKTDTMVTTNYNGNQVLSAYTPINVGDTKWALIAEMSNDEAFASLNELKWTVYIMAIVGVALIVLVAFFVTRSIAKPISRAIDGLTTGAEQLAIASDQVSDSSQHMAEGASEQAATIEETSASLEELSSMTKMNADNTKQAYELVTNVQSSAEKSKDAMSKMSGVIGKIKTSSDETAKILKTIDEIAFQTNLLALNAAVEAARAGEAGKGFAVVAEEVRNLAQRSAQAAKDTATLIEEAQHNAEDGVSNTNEVASILNEVVKGVIQVSLIINEVSAAGEEQTKGIEQINDATHDIDKATQATAANAEESAAASEELSSQAKELNSVVTMLAGVIGGQCSNTNGSTQHHESHIGQRHKMLHDLAHKTIPNNGTAVPATVTDHTDCNDQNEIIPLDDEEMKRF